MSVTMVALKYSAESAKELIEMGFFPMDVYVSYKDYSHMDYPLTEKGISTAVGDMMSFGTSAPLQFAVTPYYSEGKQAGVVKVALSLRENTKQIIDFRNFKKVMVFAKRGASGPTVEAIPKDEQEFLNMKFPPEKWYADSYWGAGE